DGVAGEPGDRVADLGVALAADPADVAVAGQAVLVVTPVPEPPGDVAAEHLAPARLEPLPAQPEAGDQPDPGGLAGAEEPAGGPGLLDVHGAGSFRLVSDCGGHVNLPRSSAP